LQSGPFVSSGVRLRFLRSQKIIIHGSASTTPSKKNAPVPSDDISTIMRMRMHHEARLRSYYERSESSFDAEMNEFWLGRLSDMIVRRIPKSRSMGRFRTRISVPRFDYISTAGYVRSLFYIVFLPLLALFPSFGLFVFGQMSAAR
jgi:hypothetical protein